MPPADAATTRPAGRFPVIGTWVDSTDPARAVATIARWIGSGRREYVCVANVHAVMEAHRDPALRAVYDAAGLTVPDGMPLVWTGRALGHADVRRVYGPDLMLALCAAAAEHDWPCYFHGGQPGVAARVVEALRSRFPGLRVAGASFPPFRALDAAEQAEERGRINDAKPVIVFVGLGCPKQERWMAAQRPHLDAPVLIGVGAAFDFHAGMVRQAPRWMMRAGLEWLFRLGQEPRRLWFRYLVYNPLFVFHLALQMLRVRRYTTAASATRGPT
jgi:N-acetylglucosaminyldiphosphoundecaprenol N-acetyl-beta-D-mannosaminyltransferase